MKKPQPTATDSGKLEPFAEVTGKAAEALIKTMPIVLLDFSATWCYPCKLLKKQFAKDVIPKLKPNVMVISIDVDAESAYTDKMGVRAMPTLMLFHNGVRVKITPAKGDPTDALCGFDETVAGVVLAAIEALN
jgi:thioredoxin 1